MSLTDYFQENFDKLDVKKEGWSQLYYGLFSGVINDNGYKKVAEIGAGYGAHAKEVMDNTSVTKYVIIDPMVPYNDSLSGAISGLQGTTDNNFDEFYDLVNDALSDYSNRYTWLRKTTADITASEVPDSSLDCIFVDGDHSYDAVKMDLEFAWAKVRSGGQILGDDYWMGDVARAVDEFAAENGLEVTFLSLVEGGYKIYNIQVSK
jgi:hypothetical protein